MIKDCRSIPVDEWRTGCAVISHAVTLPKPTPFKASGVKKALHLTAAPHFSGSGLDANQGAATVKVYHDYLGDIGFLFGRANGTRPIIRSIIIYDLQYITYHQIN